MRACWVGMACEGVLSGCGLNQFVGWAWHMSMLRCGRVSLWGHTLDQHHTGLRQVDNSSMGTHTGPTSHWVEAG